MANKKLSELTTTQTLSSTDLVYVVKDVATTPVSRGMTAESLTAAVATSSVSTNPVENTYANVAAMIADQSNQTLNFFEFVEDTEVYYEYLGTTTPSIADYRLLSDSEVLTVTGNNGYKTFRLQAIQDDSTPLTTVSNGRIGLQYDNGTDAVTGILFNSAYTRIIQRYVSLSGSVDYYINIYNRSKRQYQLAKVTGFATVNTNFTLASIENTISRNDFAVNNRLEVLFDVDVAGGSNAVLDRTGTALTFDSDAYYNKNTYLTTGNLTLSDASAINGKTGVIWCNGYVPTITGLTYLVASGSFLSNKLNIATFNYVNSTNYKAEVRVVNLSTLSSPTLSAAEGNAEIALTWSSISNADNYVIQRSLDNFATAGTQIYSGALLTFTDTGRTNGTLYYYRGISEGAGRISSGFSATVSSTPTSNLFLSNLVAAYKFEDNANDYTGNHNGTATALTYVTGGTPSVGKSADFNGSTSQVIIPTSTDFLFSDGSTTDLPFTIVITGNIDSGSGNSGFICKGNQFAVGFNNGLTLFCALYDSSISNRLRASASATVVGSYNRFVITYDGGGLSTGIKMYQNGSVLSPVAESPAVGTYNYMKDGGTDLNIGNNFQETFIDMNGKLDQIQIYKNREWTATDVTDDFALVNAGTDPIA
tara:strand:+ start:14739 stop:16682 length:1944 start_codon:yes stop_codon:yes gene_type:complete